MGKMQKYYYADVYWKWICKISIAGVKTWGIAKLIECLIGPMFILLSSLNFEHFGCVFIFLHLPQPTVQEGEEKEAIRLK